MRSTRQADQAVEVLRARGLRLTRPRRLVLEIVSAGTLHPSAYSVYNRVRRRLPHVSLGTVYRNLRVLVEMGLLRESAHPAGSRFDPNTTPHDHFTCVQCRRIYDVARTRAGRARERISSMGFQVLEHRVEFYGCCRACRQRRRKSVG
jgi:Fe2+ or Zn2+ uptake regulation protein